MTEPRLISWRATLVGTALEVLAFDLGARLGAAGAPWQSLRHVPLLLTVVGLGIWLARRDPRRWTRAVLLHVPAIFLFVTLIYEAIVRGQTGRAGALDGSPGSWGGVLLGAVTMGLGALVAAWLEPGTRARRSAARRGEEAERPRPAS